MRCVHDGAGREPFRASWRQAEVEESLGTEVDPGFRVGDPRRLELGMCVGHAHDGSFHRGREVIDLDDLQRCGTPTADHVDVARRPLHQAKDPEGGAAADDPVHGLGALDRERVVELAEQGVGGGGIDHGGVPRLEQ